MSVNQRIAEIIEYLELNPNSFSKSIGLTGNSTISRIIKMNTTPSFDTLIVIIKKYEWLNVEWLMTGNGEMVKESEDQHKVSREELEQKIKYQEGLINTLKDTLDLINKNFKES